MRTTADTLPHHLCSVARVILPTPFRRTLPRAGDTTCCPYCGLTLEYAKPSASGQLAPDGPRTHF